MEGTGNTGETGITGVVTATNGKLPVVNAEVILSVKGGTPQTVLTNAEGRYQFACEGNASYNVSCAAFGKPAGPVSVSVLEEMKEADPLTLDLQFGLGLSSYGEGGEQPPASRAIVGQPLIVTFSALDRSEVAPIQWMPPHHAQVIKSDYELEMMFEHAGRAFVEATALESDKPTNQSQAKRSRAEVHLSSAFIVSAAPVQTVRGNLGVTLHRGASEPTLDEALFYLVRNRTHAISFDRYRRFMNRILLWEENQRLPEPLERRLRDLGAHLYGTGPYQVLKLATEIFLLMECGVPLGRHHRHHHHHEFGTSAEDALTISGASDSHELAERLSQYLGCPPQLPYIRRVVEAAFPDYELSLRTGQRLLVDRINEPCLIELIWSYWHEEGMLMQTMNAICRRFQNFRKPDDRSRLLNMEISPLRPANNLLWGYIQDEPNRLSVVRRAAEYCQAYGMPLCGKLLPRVPMAEISSKFLEAFHNLLYQASVFFKEDSQTTVIADGYPLLNALKDVHLILAMTGHNGFREVSYASRVEMLLVQFILSRPEIREFLQSRPMVPYREAWMPQVDAMKTLQGWTDVTVTHFRDLAVYGEQLLLSIRYGDWTAIDNEDSAKNWARFFKEVLYGYWNAYRAVTGVDLTNPESVDTTRPSILLQRRLETQQRAVR